MAIVEIPRMQKHNRIKHKVCKEYGYTSWSDARTNAPKSDIIAILHEVIEEIK